LFTERPEGGFELIEPGGVAQIQEAVDLGQVTV
jgi:hypothetical protein